MVAKYPSQLASSNSVPKKPDYRRPSYPQLPNIPAGMPEAANDNVRRMMMSRSRGYARLFVRVVPTIIEYLDDLWAWWQKPAIATSNVILPGTHWTYTKCGGRPDSHSRGEDTFRAAYSCTPTADPVVGPPWLRASAIPNPSTASRYNTFSEQVAAFRDHALVAGTHYYHNEGTYTRIGASPSITRSPGPAVLAMFSPLELPLSWPLTAPAFQPSAPPGVWPKPQPGTQPDFAPDAKPEEEANPDKWHNPRPGRVRIPIVPGLPFVQWPVPPSRPREPAPEPNIDDTVFASKQAGQARRYHRAGSGRNRRSGEPKKEKKTNIAVVGGVGWVVFNVLTEGMDFVDAMWKAIPVEQRTRHAREHQKYVDLYRNWDKLDVAEALQNYINMQVGDMFAAFGSNQVKNVSQQLGIATGLDRAINLGRNSAGKFRKENQGEDMVSLIPTIDIDSNGDMSVVVLGNVIPLSPPRPVYLTAR